MLGASHYNLHRGLHSHRRVVNPQIVTNYAQSFRRLRLSSATQALNFQTYSLKETGQGFAVYDAIVGKLTLHSTRSTSYLYFKAPWGLTRTRMPLERLPFPPPVSFKEPNQSSCLLHLSLQLFRLSYLE